MAAPFTGEFGRREFGTDEFGGSGIDLAASFFHGAKVNRFFLRSKSGTRFRFYVQLTKWSPTVATISLSDYLRAARNDGELGSGELGAVESGEGAPILTFRTEGAFLHRFTIETKQGTTFEVG